MILRVWNLPNFTVRVSTEECMELDLSFDEDGTAREKIDSGEYEAFDVVAEVLRNGQVLADSYLSECIYENPEDFQDHKGMNHKGHGSYFSDMVKEVCQAARKQLNEAPKMRRS
jgi:hypothetical protein